MTTKGKKTKKESNPVGRPTKYDAKLHPGIVTQLAARGLTDEAMANVLEIDTRTFYRWKDAHPEFSQAIVGGKENPIEEVEDALYRLCKGYTYEEMGQIRVKHPDVRAIRFYLMNVASDKWRERRDVRHSGPDGGPIPIDDLSGLSTEELRERLSVLRGESEESFDEYLEEEADAGDGGD